VLRVGAASLITAAVTWSQWAALAAGYVELIGRVVGDVGARRTTAQDAAAVAFDGLLTYARDTAELPRLGSLRFYSELERLTKEAGSR